MLMHPTRCSYIADEHGKLGASFLLQINFPLLSTSPYPHSRSTIHAGISSLESRQPKPSTCSRAVDDLPPFLTSGIGQHSTKMVKIGQRHVPYLRLESCLTGQHNGRHNLTRILSVPCSLDPLRPVHVFLVVFVLIARFPSSLSAMTTLHSTPRRSHARARCSHCPLKQKILPDISKHSSPSNTLQTPFVSPCPVLSLRSFPFRNTLFVRYLPHLPLQQDIQDASRNGDFSICSQS